MSYHQAVRLATGEMSEVIPEEWPVHKEVADALGGELRPFDQYQGPFIAWEGKRIFIGSPEKMWMALIIGEGWVGGFAEKEEAVRQAQEALSAGGVEHDVADFVQPDSVEGYLVATVSGESTPSYPNTRDVASMLVDAIRSLGASSTAPVETETP